MDITEFKTKNGKWIIGNLNDALIYSKFDVFINSKREIKNVLHSKITKKHNYQFKTRN